MDKLNGNVYFLVVTILILFSILTQADQSQETQLKNKVLVCYWGTWSHYRNNSEGSVEGRFRIENIPPHLCTHLVYSFMGLDALTNKVISLDEWLDYDLSDSPRGGLDNIRKTIALRQQNPDLKITLAIGGWNEGSENYSVMAKEPSKRATFVQSVVEMVEKFDFDGVDMDWEYPARRGGIPEDKQNFVLLLKELREALDEVERPGRDPLLLTAAFGCYEKYLDTSYDIPEISKYLDYLHLMLYDFKMYLVDDGSGDVEPGGTLIGHHSPLFAKEWEDEGNKTMTNDFAVQSFIEKGAPAEKLVFGVGAYAKTYALVNRAKHNFYDEAAGPGAKSEFTVTEGISAYFEICRELLAPNAEWEMTFDQDYQIPYAFSDTKWMGYDDQSSVIKKTDYAMQHGLGGMMVWSLDFDDFANYCGRWGGNFTIVSTLKDRLLYHEAKTADTRKE